jgi:uncharacterized protein YegP (UPF0339 family)
MPFEIFKSEKSGKYHFRLKAGNGETILTSEAYSSKAGAENGIKSVMENAKKESRFEQRKAKNGQQYFVLKSSNDEVIGQSEMYKSSPGLTNGIKSVQKNAREGKIKDLTTA